MPADDDIDAREYARMEARRGRRHAHATLDPRRTALVVVDMISFFVDADPDGVAAATRVDGLATQLRARGGTVAWVVPLTAPPTHRAIEFYGTETAAAYAASGGPGAPRNRLWPGFTVSGDDIVVEKSAASAFFPGRCSLPVHLEARSVDTVLVVGAVTSVCCESSARDASTLGYRVIMIADLCLGGDARARSATFTVTYRSFGDVRSGRDVLALLDLPPGS